MRQLKGIELFASSAEFTKQARKRGHIMTCTDITPHPWIDIAEDILSFNPDSIGYVPDFGWASPVCKAVSIAAGSNHMKTHNLNKPNEWREPVSPFAKESMRMFLQTIATFKYYQQLNPNFIFFMENPRGGLRKLPFMQEFRRVEVFYCKYGDLAMKPTDLFTNSTIFTPREKCKNHTYDKDKNIINRQCHHEPAPRGSKSGTQGKKGDYQRSILPVELCIDVIKAIEDEYILR